MNKISIVLILAFLSCKSEQNNSSQELGSDKNIAKIVTENNDSKVVLDTLVFYKNMNGELLTEKYASGLSELKFYKQFVSENKIAEKQILTEEHTKTEITYLGILNDLNNQNLYHVITNFKIIGIGEMESPRGESYIAFLDENLDKAIVYRMALPDELPEKIEDNVLYFTLESEKIGISILGGLPPMLCLPKIGCY